MTVRTPASVWAAALGQLQITINRPHFDTWLRDTAGLAYDDGVFVVGTRTDYISEFLEVRMRKQILTALDRVIGAPVQVRFEVARAQEDDPVALSPGERPTDATGDNIPEFMRRSATPAPQLNPVLTFESFVVGEENALAARAAHAAAEEPGRTNPVVMFGGCGLGKTHLLNAIGHEALSRGQRVMFASAEKFGREYAAAAEKKSFEPFRRKYRDCDVLLLDDVQFLETRPGFQDEFLHTFDHLHQQGKQIAVTCDRLPSTVEGFSDALRSRLAWGVQADLRKPEFATRLAILRAKASQQATDLPEPVLEQIAQRCCPTVRELEGYLNRVVMHLPLLGNDGTPDAIERALAVFDGPLAPPAPPTADEIVAAVCARTSATPGDLRGRSRNRQVTYARHLAMYILRHDANKSVAEIQRLFGNRDHSTVLGSIARIEGERAMEPGTAADLAAVRDAIAAGRVVEAGGAAPPAPVVQVRAVVEK